MAAHSTLGLIPRERTSSAKAVAPAPPSLLHLEDRRGGHFLCAKFDAISCWSQELAGRNAEDGLGVRVGLANGEAVTLLQVAADAVTAKMREHYGELFATHFAEDDYGTQFVRKAHILGFSSRQGQTLHMLGNHQISGIRISVADLSPVPPVVFQQPERAATPEPPRVPLQRFPVYSPSGSYDLGALVLHDGSLYRKAGRGGNLGDPLQRIDDWEYVRTLEGPEPQRVRGEHVSRSPRQSSASEFSDHGTYSHGDVVKYKGSLYRKLTRSTRGGRPDQTPEDWDRLRTPEAQGLIHAE